jgi:hypothetical protein
LPLSLSLSLFLSLSLSPSHFPLPLSISSHSLTLSISHSLSLIHTLTCTDQRWGATNRSSWSGLDLGFPKGSPQRRLQKLMPSTKSIAGVHIG